MSRWLIITVACMLLVCTVFGVTYLEAINISTSLVSKIGNTFNQIAGLSDILSDRTAYLVNLDSQALGNIEVDGNSYSITDYIRDNFLPDVVRLDQNINDLSLKVSPTSYEFTLRPYFFSSDRFSVVPDFYEYKITKENSFYEVQAIRVDITMHTQYAATQGTTTYHIFIFVYDNEIYYMLCDDSFTVGQVSKKYDSYIEFTTNFYSYYSLIDQSKIKLMSLDEPWLGTYYDHEYYIVDDFSQTSNRLNNVVENLIYVKENS